MGYGNKFFTKSTRVAGAILAGAMVAALTIQTASAQQYYPPDYDYPGPYTNDPNARYNNEIHAEDYRARQYRRQLRRERLARQRARQRARAQARARAKRQRLYDVRRREIDRQNKGGYDYYGNPIPSATRRNAPPVRKTRERVKLVYVPLPRKKPLLATTTKVATKPANTKVFTPSSEPQKKQQKAVKIATIPKIEIETLPNPNTPKVFKPTKPTVTTSPKAALPKVTLPKVATPKTKATKQTKPKVFTPAKPSINNQKKIKYTTFAETLRKIRERNAAQKRREEKAAENATPKTKKPATTTPQTPDPTTKPVVKAPAVKKLLVKKVEIKAPETKTPEIKKIAAITPKPVVLSKPKIDNAEPRLAANQISCKKAQKIISDYGFSDVSKVSCTGKNYDFKAKRDGTAFKITLSALSGELTKVLKQK